MANSGFLPPVAGDVEILSYARFEDKLRVGDGGLCQKEGSYILGPAAGRMVKTERAVGSDTRLPRQNFDGKDNPSLNMRLMTSR